MVAWKIAVDIGGAFNSYNILFEQANSSRVWRIVEENEGNLKSLWNSFKNIMHKVSDEILPDHTNVVDLPNMFWCYFSEKIFKIESGLQSSSLTPVIRYSRIENTLFSFTPVSEYDVLQILTSSCWYIQNFYQNIFFANYS